MSPIVPPNVFGPLPGPISTLLLDQNYNYLASQVLDSVSALRLTTPKTPSVQAPIVYLRGGSVPGDGAGGWYYFNAADTTSVDNGDTVVLGADTGRWYRLQPLMVVRNAVYNGDFDLSLNPAATALPTSPTPIVAFDQWAIFQNTASAGISAQVACDIPGFRYYLKIGRNNGSASTNSIIAEQAIKTADSIAYQGKICTFSFFAKAGANFSGGNISVGVFSGTGIDEGVTLMGQNSWTGATIPVSVAQSITTTGTRYTFTSVIPSNCSELGWRVFYNPTGTAGADDNLYLTGFKFEQGITPSGRDLVPYRERTYINRPISPQADYFGNFGVVDPFWQGQLVPFGRGNGILINGNIEIIPSGSISTVGGIVADYTSCYVNGVPATALAVNTLYYVFAFMNAGVMTLDFWSGVSHAPDAQTGIQVRSGGGTVNGIAPAAESLVGFIVTATQKTIRSFGAITGGSGYVNNTYTNVPLTGGSGSAASATIVVSGGSVTSVSFIGSNGNFGGLGYATTDTLSASNANLGGSGSGFSIPVATISACARGGAAAQTAISWNNRLRFTLNNSVAVSTTSASWVEQTTAATRLQWVQWGSDLPIGPKVLGNFGSTVASDVGQIGIGVSGVNVSSIGTPPAGSPDIGTFQAVSTLAGNNNVSAQWFNNGGEGYYQASVLAQRVSGTGTISGTAYYWIENNAV